MDLTFKNLAEKYGTTKANMRSRIKKLERDNPEIQITQIKKNTTVLTDAGFRLLEEEATRRPFTTKKKQPAPEVKETDQDSSKDYTKNDQIKYSIKDLHRGEIKGYIDNTLIELLKSEIESNKRQIEVLQSQLEIKDKQLEAKDNQIADLIETIKDNINLTGHAQTIIEKDRRPLEMPQSESQPAPQAKEEVIEIEEAPEIRPKKHSFISKLIVASRIFRQ